MTRPSISIIGPGKVGCALARLAQDAGYVVNAVGGRDSNRVSALATTLGEPTRALSISDAAGASDLVLLTVSDSAIGAVASEIARANSLRDGAVVAHCSGALTSECLEPMKSRRDVAIGSFHPLQTFATVEGAMARLPGSHGFLEGEPRAVEILARWGADLGMECVRIATSAKVLYHAGAVFACNYLCTLLGASLDANEAAGIDRATAMRALRPLIESTLDNVLTLGPDVGLTGPIRRGDVQTVEMHVRALAAVDPSLVRLYRVLGVHTLELAEASQRFDESTRAAMLRALQDLDRETS